MEIKPLTWIQTDGGPFILLPKIRLNDWEGVDGPAGQTHYDLACKAYEFAEAIDFAGFEAIILGDIPTHTAIWLDSNGTTYILRFVTGESEEHLYRHLPRLVHHEFDAPVKVEWPYDELFLFDSAYPGNELPDDYLTIPLSARLRSVSSSMFEPDDETAAIVHRLNT